MYLVEVRQTFAAAHNLRQYKGKCENIHGHNWIIKARIRGSELNPTGMLIDFRDLKQMLKNILELLDHHYLNETAPFNLVNPTAENIARFIHLELKQQLDQHNQLSGASLAPDRIYVWESENSLAIFQADD